MERKPLKKAQTNNRTLLYSNLWAVCLAAFADHSGSEAQPSPRSSRGPFFL